MAPKSCPTGLHQRTPAFFKMCENCCSVVPGYTFHFPVQQQKHNKLSQNPAKKPSKYPPKKASSFDPPFTQKNLQHDRQNPPKKQQKIVPKMVMFFNICLVNFGPILGPKMAPREIRLHRTGFSRGPKNGLRSPKTA